mgnify:CR=1 FL=1
MAENAVLIKKGTAYFHAGISDLTNNVECLMVRSPRDVRTQGVAAGTPRVACPEAILTFPP